MKNLLTREFLESKLSYYEHKYYGTCLHKASSGNIDRISDNVFKFTQYNFLPETDGQLDGHYTFYVNVTNFKYLLYKSSFYGSLTYTTESLDTNWVTNLIERELIKVESIIADKILGSYFYDSNGVNQNGKSLISTNEFKIEGINNYGQEIKRWNDGYKKCLITDYRGYIWVDLKPNERSDKDIEAIKLLEPEYKIREVKSYKLGKIEEKILLEENYIIEGKKPKEMKLNNIQYLVPIDIEYTDNSSDKIYFARELTGLYSRNFLFLDKDKKKMMKYSSNYRGKPSNIIKIIPEFIKSL